MKCSYKKKIYNKRKTHKKRSLKKRSYKKRFFSQQRGGGCGCNSKMSGGSSGPSNFSQLSPNNYAPYYNVQQDPNNAMVSTSISSKISGGGRKQKQQYKKIYKQTGGISAQDMVSSLGNGNLVNNVSHYLTASNYNSTPGFLDNNLSVNQPATVLPNVPYFSPGMSYLV